MKYTITHIAEWILLGIITILLCYTAWKSYTIKEKVEYITDTIQFCDTLYFDSVSYDTVFLQRLDSVYLPIVHTKTDTIIQVDSVLVQIPYMTTVYDTTINKEDYQTHLKATVTGFNSTLDEVLLETTVFQKQPVISQKKWYEHIAPACGVGIGTDGKIGLFVGIGYTL